MIDITQQVWTIGGDVVIGLERSQDDDNRLIGVVEFRYYDWQGFEWTLDGECIEGATILNLTNEPPITPLLEEMVDITDKLNYFIKAYKKDAYSLEQYAIMDKVLEKLGLPYRIITTNEC